MSTRYILTCIILISLTVYGYPMCDYPICDKNNNNKGIQCYNCLTIDHPGCWNPKHPDHSNITVPNVDCYIPGEEFYCIIITAESATLVETDRTIGAVRARTCILAKEMKNKEVSHSMCTTLGKELSTSEVFTRIIVMRPQCEICKSDLCVDNIL